MNRSTQPNALPEGVWQSLLGHAFTLVDEIGRSGISDPFWTFGGGTVLMLPGRTEHAEKYGTTAERLAAAGYASAALDWRGQGLADRLLPDRRKGHVGQFADYQRDLDAFAAAVRETLPGPFYLLAHSMGGCIGLRGLMRGLDVAAAAFSAPMWGLDMPGGREGLFTTGFGLAARAGLRDAQSSLFGSARGIEGGAKAMANERTTSHRRSRESRCRASQNPAQRRVLVY